jgi:predicted nuclease with TOPRIM domain
MFGTKLSNKVSQVDFDEKVAELSATLLLNTKLEAKLDEARTTIENLSSEKTKQTKAINQHKIEMENIKSQHNIEMEAMKNSVNRKINQSLASIGVDKFASEIYSDIAQKSDRELLNQFVNLP